MNVDDLFTTEGDDTVVLRVHAHPGAGRSAVVGRHGAALKVRVAAPPIDGRANVACAELLAEEFGLKTAQVALVGGDTSRAKTFTLSGVDVEEFRRHLEQVAGGTPPRGKPGGQVHQGSEIGPFGRR
ncbi:MAG TPA: DUF167 domain-containing protein [Acidimicrobiales bacterium]|nr:DUF167 domain-containing protein [Acidimicrobiales bacterium]